MPRIERDIRKWLGSGLTFKGQGEHGLVRAILNSFQSVYIRHTEEMEILEVLTKVTGHDGVLSMLGSAVCMADGSRELKLEPR